MKKNNTIHFLKFLSLFLHLGIIGFSAIMIYYRSGFLLYELSVFICVAHLTYNMAFKVNRTYLGISFYSQPDTQCAVITFSILIADIHLVYMLPFLTIKNERHFGLRLKCYVVSQFKFIDVGPRGLIFIGVLITGKLKRISKAAEVFFFKKVSERQLMNIPGKELCFYKMGVLHVDITVTEYLFKFLWFRKIILISHYVLYYHDISPEVVKQYQHEVEKLNTVRYYRLKHKSNETDLIRLEIERHLYYLVKEIEKKNTELIINNITILNNHN